MPHPIHVANEESPYGDLTREEFYRSHRIIHHESFMLNSKNMKIFTQSWCPADSGVKPRGLVAMVHGYTSDSSWLMELTAVAIAEAGFLVCALDLQGHGLSDGFPGHIPNIEPIVHDCRQYFDSVKGNHPKLPAFLYGESLGGAICLMIYLKEKKQWDGLILNGSMCGISAKFKPTWPLEKLLPVVVLFAPTWNTMGTKPVSSKSSYKEEWKRKLAAKNPHRPSSGKPSIATAMEFLRVCELVTRHCHEIEAPLLIVHGEDDRVCDPNSARFVYESAASKDKTLKVFAGMWHMLIGEPKENVELVFKTILGWLGERADRAKTSEMIK